MRWQATVFVAVLAVVFLLCGCGLCVGYGFTLRRVVRGVSSGVPRARRQGQGGGKGRARYSRDVGSAEWGQRLVSTPLADLTVEAWVRRTGNAWNESETLVSLDSDLRPLPGALPGPPPPPEPPR